MKYQHKNKKFCPWNHLPGLVAVMVLYVILTGCATSKSKPEALPLVYNPGETINLDFRSPLIIKTPEQDPVTTEEHIRCGLFYFEQERFGDAATQFEKAGQRISDGQNPLYRACLMSAAVCQLLADDKPAFMKAVQELKSSFSRYELLVIEGKDERVKAIFGLYDAFLKTGNY